jgi:uncharacterized membrane protein YraQ (UPF0718 family)
MRLLREESGFELVGAFCVAAFALAVAWTILESMFGLSAIVAGLFSAVVAGWVLEMISRRHYADRLAPAPRRTARSPVRLVPTETRVAEPPSASPTARPEQPDAAPAGPPVEAPSTDKPAESERPADERPAAERRTASGRPGARTVAGRRAGPARRAA